MAGALAADSQWKKIYRENCSKNDTELKIRDDTA